MSSSSAQKAIDWASVRECPADPSAPAAVYIGAETPDGRIDHVALTAYQRETRGSTEVTLRVLKGRRLELEIWGHQYGLRLRIDVSKLERQYRLG